MIARPSRRGHRPRALDLSFGIDSEDLDDSATTSDASRKRDRGDAADAADLRVCATWTLYTVTLTSGSVCSS